MTRTVRWLSVARSLSQWLALAMTALVFACERQKDALLRELAPTTR